MQAPETRRASPTGSHGLCRVIDRGLQRQALRTQATGRRRSGLRGVEPLKDLPYGG